MFLLLKLLLLLLKLLPLLKLLLDVLSMLGRPNVLGTWLPPPPAAATAAAPCRPTAASRPENARACTRCRLRSQRPTAHASSAAAWGFKSGARAAAAAMKCCMKASSGV